MDLNAILDYIARTNLFNFAIFLAIIIFVYKKLNVTGQLEQGTEDVKAEIESSVAKKTESEEKLSSIESSLAHIEEEIDSILDESEENAKLVGEKILEDARKTALTIQENSGKAIENSRIILKNELIKRASLASVEIAKSRIIDELNKNSGLHDKLIDESINAIEGIEIE